MKKTILTKNQKQEFKKKITYCGKPCNMTVTVRYDDECGNGHNSFAITGWIKSVYGREEAGGCIHDEIAEHFPELKHLIKWHSMNSDMPLHYIANTTYWASDRTHSDKEIGEAVAFDTELKFNDIPFSFKQQEKGFWDYLNNVGDFNNIEVEAVKYDGGGNHDYSDNYSLTGFIPENADKKWYLAPFKSLKSAEQFLEALQNNDYSYVKTPTKWCEAVEPELDNARSCAIWEDATLEQLRDKEALKEHLDNWIMPNFIKDIEAMGFIY